jgi:hypothetical protein
MGFLINSGCQLLLTPGADAYSDTCVSVEDQNRDGRSDGITTRFTGEDNHQYELRAQADPSTNKWGSGSEVTLTDRTFGQPPQVLAHYSVTANYTLAPLDVGTNECLPSPTPVRRDSSSADSIPMPNGQEAIVAIRDNARTLDANFQEVKATWVKLGVASSSRRVTLQITSEDTLDQHVFAVELGAGHTRRQARFTPPR